MDEIHIETSTSEKKECKFPKKIIFVSIVLLVVIGILTFAIIRIKKLELFDNSSPEGTMILGKSYYHDFLIDNMLEFSDNTEQLHFHIYIPKGHDMSKQYALYITLPGYGSYYFQGVAINLKIEDFADEAKKYNPDMIIVAPQPNDWGRNEQEANYQAH